MMLQVHDVSALAQEDFVTAPCLAYGPIAESARSLIWAARQLGHDKRAAYMRARAVLRIFESMERVFASGVEPIAAFNEALDEQVRSLNDPAQCDTWESNNGAISGSSVEADDNGQPSSTLSDDVKGITADHYGRLFQSFSETSFWDEPVQLLRSRLERNEISISGLGDKRVLDAGCGGGRYSVAWHLLTSSRVVGLDASDIGVSDARRRVDEANIVAVDFEQGNVLDLPFEDNSFDVVFSNGVLHHTTDWRRGIRELLRVLKPGGLGWLYLIENPGGLFWDTIEILRVMMKDESRNNARKVLQLLGVPANSIFYMLDHVMVPINIRLTPAEIFECLEGAQAIEIRRLKRGASFDRIEKIHQEEPYADLKYGVGENRYVFSKG